MSEENSPRGILSAEDAEALLVKRAMPEEEEAEADTSETDEADEVEEVESDEVVDDDATDEDEDESEDDTAEEIDAEELNKGYLRQQDYTKKTQEIAAQRQQLEAQRQQFEAHAQRQLEQLEQAVKAFSVQTEAEPDWPKLAKELDPKDYLARQAAWTDKQTKARQAREIQQRIADERHETTRQREANLLLERIPEWRDENVLKTETAEIISVASQFGLSEDEVSSIMDHRQIQILRTLAVAQRAQKAAAKKQSKPRKKVNAAASPQKVDERDVKTRELSARLKKTGSVEDAVDILLSRSA